MILHLVCHFDSTNSVGGLEKQARLLGRHLRAAGEDVFIVSSTRQWGRAGMGCADGIPIRLFWTYASPQVSGRYLPAALLWAAQVLWWIFWNRNDVEIIHCHQLRIHSFVGALARLFWGIPVVQKSATGGAGADIRVIGTRKYFGAVGRRFVIRWSSVFIATTQTVREDLLHWGVGDDRIRLIPNGLVLPTGEGRAVPPDQRMRRFVFLGRLAEDKNILALAEAAEIAFKGSQNKLSIYGDGPDVESLRSLLSERSFQHVAYEGFVSDTGPVLQRAGYLVLPSNGEGLSNAMLEAMVYGVVPITTRVSGCVDHVLEGVRGYYMEGVDVGSIAAALTPRALTEASAWMTMSSSVAEYARDRFGMDSVVAAYRSLYQNLRVVFSGGSDEMKKKAT